MSILSRPLWSVIAAMVLTFCLLAGALAFGPSTDREAKIPPRVVTEKTPNDTDDPAIWVHPTDPERSLVIGTDKDEKGGLYVFDLAGRLLREKTVYPLRQPNNVDVEYGLRLAGQQLDIAVTTERLSRKLRVYALPEMNAIDGGGLEVFHGEEGETGAPMGIALFKRPGDGAIFAVVSRKTGPREGYLWQYLLHDDGSGRLRATLIRKFGAFSGKNEVEAIAVDDELGYVYYSDEGTGVRKYFADPSNGNHELAFFATEGFVADQEGISIYRLDAASGYLLVSNQGADTFHVYPREGSLNAPHHHPLLKSIRLSTRASDGSDVTAVPLGPAFPRGLFVAMSDDRTFHYYRWEDLALVEPGPKLASAENPR